ncbi:hypothetical protein BDV19DRAFT_384481 [Aspergillus venezuelensis]
MEKRELLSVITSVHLDTIPASWRERRLLRQSKTSAPRLPSIFFYLGLLAFGYRAGTTPTGAKKTFGGAFCELQLLDRTRALSDTLATQGQALLSSYDSQSGRSRLWQPAGDTVGDHLNLGYRMLEVAGIIESPISDPVRYRAFRDSYRTCRSGGKMSEEQTDELHLLLRALRNDALARADVIVCTPFAASSASLRHHFSPAAVFVDDAARLKGK